MDIRKRFQRILLATDGSEQSQAAVDATIAIAKSPTVKVKVAHVWNLELHHRHGHWDVDVRSEASKLTSSPSVRGASRTGSRSLSTALAATFYALSTVRC